MTDPQPKPRPENVRPVEEAPLKLEDTSDGSTQPVDDEDVAASGSDGLESSGPLSASSSGPSAGGTTGGFETMLGKLVIDRGLATAEELELCDSLLKQAPSVEIEEEQPRTLADVLIDNDVVTRRQLERLRDEFDAQKSTRSIPGYRIREKLGSGAMATVFLGRQISLDRLVAIKVLPKKFSDNAKFIDRFYKEGRAAAQLNHPNIVAAYDVGKAGDHHYFVMEYVDGFTIHERLVKQKRLKESEAIKITKQVARALQHAHKRGFIHRDIKPKNVMITRQGVVKLADLGLARAMSDKEAAKAEAGRAYGTPYYISPEQIRGEVHIGPQADIYGLGATLYHMVTGRVPFEGKNPSAVMHQHLKADLEPPDHVNPHVSAGCAQLIEMMMAKDPTDRYQSASDLLEDLDLLMQGKPLHYARRGIDISPTTVASLTGPAPDDPSAAVPMVVDDAPEHGPAFTILVTVAIVSVLINVILLLVLAVG